MFATKGVLQMKLNKHAKNPTRERDMWCNLVITFSKEVKENDSRLNRVILNTALRNLWMFSKPLTKILASEKAYRQFYRLTKQDIRNFDDDSSIKINNKSKKVRSMFTFEHLTTVNDFTEEVKNKSLTKKRLLDLAKKQWVCWITKAEDKKLRNKGYLTKRPDPFKAYDDCNITIYEKEKYFKKPN